MSWYAVYTMSKHHSDTWGPPPQPRHHDRAHAGARSRSEGSRAATAAATSPHAAAAVNNYGSSFSTAYTTAAMASRQVTPNRSRLSSSSACGIHTNTVAMTPQRPSGP